MIFELPYSRVLSAFSSVTFSLPETRELSKQAETLYGLGYLTRKKQIDPRDSETRVSRWAYRRTETGSKAIGA